jgi:hypothetical protein
MIALCDPVDAFRPLSATRKAALVGEILATYWHVRWSLWRNDLQSALDRLTADVPIREPDRGSFVNGMRLGRAVGRTLRLLPSDSRCLVRSLVLTSMLARRGIQSSLVIGVRSEPEFAAHAWVEHRGAPLLPDEEYGRLVELSASGTAGSAA